MAETVGDVVVRVGADIGDFTRGMKSASGDTDKLSSAAARAAKVGAAMGVALAAAGALAAGAMAAMSKQGLAFVDTQAKAARSVDATIDGLRALTLAGEEAGISTDEMVASMQTMQRELAKAASEGGTAAKMLDAIGMSASSLAGMDADERLAAIADRSKELGLSAGETMRLLQALGVRSRNMALLVANGGDAIREAGEAVKSFGLSVSEEAAGGIEAANDAVGRMSLVMEGLRNKLAISVAPALTAAAVAFQEITQQGGPLQDTINRVAESVSKLAGTLLSPDFIKAAAAFGGGMLDAVNLLAMGFQGLVENGEAVARMAAVLGGAIVAMGGPLTWAIALLGGAAAAMISMKGGSEEVEASAPGFQSAIRGNSEKLLTMANATKAAREELAKLISLQLSQAGAAAAPIGAEFDKQLAELEAAERSLNGRAIGMFEGTPDLEKMREGVQKVREEYIAANEVVQRLNDQRIEAEKLAAQENGSVSIATPELPGLPTMPGAGGGKGEGGADKVASDMAARLEALTAGLQTERETVELWYQEGLETINAASEAELEALGGKHEALERLEKEHQERLKNIKDMGNSMSLKSVLQGGSDVLGAMSAFSDKALKAQAVTSAGMALMNTLEGASAELKKGVFGFASAALVMAKGLAFVGAIKSAGSGGGSSSSGGSATSSAAAETAAPQPQNLANINLYGNPTGSQMGELVDTLNDAFANGYRLNLNIMDYQ